MRCVVTGLGATTPLGGDVATTWSAMLAGKSGVTAITDDWAEQVPARIAARVAVEPADAVLPGGSGEPVKAISRSEMRRLDRCEQFALIAARQAWRDAGFDVGTRPPPDRVGVVVSSGIGGVVTTINGWDTFKEKGWQRLSPYTVPMLMPNGPAGWVALDIEARAGTHAPVSACSSGAEAIGYAIDMIRSGRADVVVAGGTEAAIHPLNIGAFAAMRALSTRNDEPERASRPYDKGRDGFVLGEGAGVIVLESEEHALARGANILAEAAGVGYSSDAHHIAQSHPEGLGAAAAMTAVLRDAGLTPDDVVHVNAHATSTPVGDLPEVLAVQRTIGHHPIVSATKSMTGHLLGGAGGLESIATVLALRTRTAPPTINLEDPDDEIKLEITRDTPRELPSGTIAAINNSFGFGGHNVAVAFRRA